MPWRPIRIYLLRNHTSRTKNKYCGSKDFVWQKISENQSSGIVVSQSSILIGPLRHGKSSKPFQFDGHWQALNSKEPEPSSSQIEINIQYCIVFLGLVILKPLTQWPGLHGTCYFHARANPSAGMFPFAQSMMCNLNNYCYNQSQHEEIPTFPGSRWVFYIHSK